MLGDVVYLRTYSRYQDHLQRRERWEETVDRVVAYSASLSPISDKEKNLLKNTLLHHYGFPAGRTLWAAGTSMINSNAAANYNCAFTDLRHADDFRDLVMLLMSGSGVGFRVTKDNIEALNRNLPIPQAKPYVWVKSPQWVGFNSPHYHEVTKTGFHDGEYVITVGDSREGWAEAVAAFLLAYSKGYPIIQVHLDAVRPLGTPLKRFGGWASGPKPLEEFFSTATRLLNESTAWTDVLALDLANLIGRMVVAGGTRRSAQIALGDVDSVAFVNAKTGDWWSKAPWRAQSNNSVLFDHKPSRKVLLQLFDRILQYGEPGLVNVEAALRRRSDFRGLNPCAEILLRNKGVCNLATIVLPKHIQENDVDEERLHLTARILTRHAIRITLSKFPKELDAWQKVQDQDRLIGISFTGLDDFIQALGWPEIDVYALLARIRISIHEEAQRYSQELGIPVPLLATTVKPEGTLSLVSGVSSGVHPAYAPYYLRRVRISKHDAVAKALYFLGLEPKPEVGFTSLEEADTWVFEFPIKTPAYRKAHDYSAIEQLERYRTIQQVWTDHNTSITVYLHPSEKEAVVDWLLDNWEHYVAVSFLPKDDKTYPLMPFEAISQEEYQRRIQTLPDFSRLHDYVAAIEATGLQSSDELDPSCASGACPVR